MSKSFVLGLTVGLLIVAVGAVGASRRQRAREGKIQSQISRYNNELTDATEAQFGLLTENQRINSRLLYPYRPTASKTIKERLPLAEGRFLEIDVSGQGHALIEPQTPESYFGELLSASDAVIHGTATKRTSAFTDDEAFIFTDYDFVLTEVLKGNADKTLTVGSTITVTRPGGKVVVDGIIVKAHDRGFEPLPLNRPLLLFLRYIPQTGTYSATRDVGTFEVDGSLIRSLSMSPYPPGVLRDGATYLQIIRDISQQK